MVKFASKQIMKNFENKLKDPNFEYTCNAKCLESETEEIDLSQQMQ